jgi:hypothetical protein
LDPDILWEEIVGLADDHVEEDGPLGELAQKVSDLRDWLSRGGYVPKAMTEGH